VVGLVLLLMVMQILALAFPNRWYLKLFWFEGAAATQQRAREEPLLRQTSQACPSLTKASPAHPRTYLRCALAGIRRPTQLLLHTQDHHRRSTLGHLLCTIASRVCVVCVWCVWCVVCATCRVCVPRAVCNGKVLEAHY